MLSSIAKNIIDLLASLLTFQPITEITLFGLLVLYIQYFILAMLITIPVLYLTKNMVLKSKKEITFKSILIFVPLENLVFRYIPLIFLGSFGLQVAHFIWAFCHVLPPAILFIGISGLLVARLWLGGLWLLGFLVHLFHDLFWFSILTGLKNLRKNDKKEDKQ